MYPPGTEAQAASSPAQGPKRQPGTGRETSGGPGCRAPREAFRLAELPTALPGGQWRPGFGRESSGRPGRHPPLEGCRPARGPGGLPGRSLSLSLGRESEARGRAATGVKIETNLAKPESGAQTNDSRNIAHGQKSPARRILWLLSSDEESNIFGVAPRPEQKQKEA